MPDSIYQFACSFAVRKSADAILTDMELATDVLDFLRLALVTENRRDYEFVTESIHPIMIGPKGGTPVDDAE